MVQVDAAGVYANETASGKEQRFPLRVRISGEPAEPSGAEREGQRLPSGLGPDATGGDVDSLKRQGGCERDAARRRAYDVSCATGTGAWWPKANARYNVSQSGSR